MVKVVQERVVRRQDAQRLLEGLQDLRAEALGQPGYVTGETWFRGDDPVTVLVVATWLSEDHWKAWETSEARVALNDFIAPVLVDEPRTSIYRLTFE
jgi:heme-degrading monooxygenase HmoA